MRNVSRKVATVAALMLVLTLFAATASAMKPGSQVGAEKDQVQGDPVVPGPEGDGSNDGSPGPGGDSAGDGVPDNPDPEGENNRQGNYW